MNKQEFIEKLSKSLEKLTEEDRKKVLSKYKSTFTRKSKKGKSDEEIIAEFGPYNEMVNQILKDHNVETPIEESANVISDFFKEFLNVVEDIVNYISKQDVRDIIKFIIQIILVLILISILKLPILFIRDLGTGILDLLFVPLSTVLIFVWRFVLEVSYVIIAITVFVKVFNKMIRPTVKK